MVTPLRAPTQSAAPHDPRKEYVAAGGLFSTRMGAVISSLFADDAELVAGADVYERMLTDGKVSACRNVLRDSVLADDVQVYPAVSDEKNPDFELAREIAGSCTHSLSCLRRPFRMVLRDSLGDALAFGHKVAEITYKDYTDELGRPRLVHDTIKLKPRSAAQFVVDEFSNVLGLQVWSPTTGVRMAPREKFFAPAFNRKDEDPRGRSILRPAYNWWVAKKAGIPVYVKRVEKKALPSMVGFTSDKEDQTLQAEDGTEQKSAPQVMAEQLASLENFSAAAFPGGAKAEVLDATGNGTEFTGFFKDCNDEIATAIVWVTLATAEGRYGTRAQSKTHKDEMGTLIWAIRGDFADMIRLDVVKPWAYYNYGDDGLRLLPYVGLGNADQRDWVDDSEAAARWAPWLADSQWKYVTRNSGIPDPEEGEPLPPRASSQPPAQGETGGDGDDGKDGRK